MIKEYCLLCLLGLLWLPALAQKKNEAYRLPIHKTTLPVEIDGVMDEAAWQDAAVAGDFFMVLPMDTSKARVRTEVRMTYEPPWTPEMMTAEV